MLQTFHEAKHHFTLALEVRTQQNDPEGWATVQANLANAYARRVHGDKLVNLHCCVAQLESALTIYARANAPEIWADLQTNLGSTYLELAR